MRHATHGPHFILGHARPAATRRLTQTLGRRTATRGGASWLAHRDADARNTKRHRGHRFSCPGIASMVTLIHPRTRAKSSRARSAPSKSCLRSTTRQEEVSLYKSVGGVRFAQACCAAQSVRWARRKRRAGLRTQRNDVHCWVMVVRVVSWHSKTGVAAVAVSAISAVAGQRFVGAAQRRPNPSVNRRANGRPRYSARKLSLPRGRPLSPGYHKR